MPCSTTWVRLLLVQGCIRFLLMAFSTARPGTPTSSALRGLTRHSLYRMELPVEDDLALLDLAMWGKEKGNYWLEPRKYGHEGAKIGFIPRYLRCLAA